ncbi:MAG: thioesterase family protein [Actinomycetota bacterium]|nr:thioesterase family protein [Actinomycetota bacterium]
MNVDQLLDILAVEPGDDVDHFIGNSPADRDRPVYGGQLLAQALMAAGATVDSGRAPHSLHAYFVRSGSAHTPIDYRVERIRDGRGFSHRSVVAFQSGREIFRQMASFQVPTGGPSYQEPTSVDVALDPSTFVGYRDWVRDLSDNQDHPWFAEVLPIDLRYQGAPAPRPRAPITGVQHIWMRLLGRVPTDDPVLHAALLAWMSDKTISDVTMYPHAQSWTDAGFDILSLDHSMYFYEPARADEWILFTHEAPATRGGRGLARGDMITLEGRRVGALTQEALLVAPTGDGASSRSNADPTRGQ